MNKKNRHTAILEIISTQKVENQDRLLKLLTGRGFNLTQATLSRDIKELKIGRIPTDSGKYVYQTAKRRIGEQAENAAGLSHGIRGVEFSGNLAVVKTKPGYAMSIAAEIDGQIPQEIIGTIAGDDTILLVVRENVRKEDVKRALNEFINGK
ncbi:MAG: ArgR family transcriptional regulator [Prevotella sp.]|jgi:transcriptional regulator of arginine metabolism|nr:ArgR family transcriptional regulator [Prevotella sp.]